MSPRLIQAFQLLMDELEESFEDREHEKAGFLIEALDSLNEIGKQEDIAQFFAEFDCN